MGRLFLLAFLAAAVGLAGCEQNPATIADAPGDGAAPAAEGTGGYAAGSSAAPSAGQSQTGQAVTPSDGSPELPNFLPLYPGAKVTSSFSAPDSTMNGGTVSFQTSAQPTDIIAFYRQKFTEQGMREALSAASGDSMTYMAAKEQTMVQVIASKGPDLTETVLSWSAPP